MKMMNLHFLAVLASLLVSTKALPPHLSRFEVENEWATSKTIVDLAVATSDLSTLVAALKAGSLVSTLSGQGPFTVFAPSNEAFAKLPAGVLTRLLKPENKAQLVDVLTYHVVSGAAIHSTDLRKPSTTTVKTVEGDTLGVYRACSDRKCKRATRVFIDPKPGFNSSSGHRSNCSQYEAKVTSRDNDAANGVVHIIDGADAPQDHREPRRRHAGPLHARHRS